MPLVPKQEVKPSDLYGMTKVDTNLSFRERVRKKWRPGDTVQVRNITNQTLEWQWLDEQDEEYVIEDDTNIKITDRDDPGLWRIGPGETDVLPGSCAYLMADAQYKMICVMKTGIVINPLSEREIRNFSLDDPEKQEQFITEIYEGKITQSSLQKAAMSQLGSRGTQVLENLRPLATERDEWQRRQEAERRMRAPALPPAGVDEPDAPAQHTDLQDLAEEFAPGAPLLGTATGGLPDDDHRPIPTATEDGEGDENPKDPPAPEGDKPAVEEPKQKQHNGSGRAASTKEPRA